MDKSYYFLEIELENILPFEDKSKLDLSDGRGNWRQWTIILGDNGVGKTTLLRILASLEVIDVNNYGLWYRFAALGGDENYAYPGPRNNYQAVVFAQNNTDSESSIKAKVYNAIPPLNAADFDLVIRYHTGGSSFEGLSYHNLREGNRHMPVYSYGGSRIMGEGFLSEDTNDVCKTLFNEHEKLINAEEWLLQLDYAASRESEIKNYAITRSNEVKRILIDLMPDVEDIRFTEPNRKTWKPIVQFKTPFGWVTIHQLSLGYKSMVAWMVDLSARMFQRYPDSSNPISEPAIVIVDEIDLHLHPKWQQKIFNYLSEKFPNTQFIVTAHSPIAVQAAPSDANVILLRKEGERVVIDSNTESVHNWRLDQIISSDLFGFDGTRNSEINQWMLERTSLLQKNERTPEERRRLNELNEMAHKLPTAQESADIEAMRIINEAANFFRNSGC